MRVCSGIRVWFFLSSSPQERDCRANEHDVEKFGNYDSAEYLGESGTFTVSNVSALACYLLGRVILSAEILDRLSALGKLVSKSKVAFRFGQV